MLNRLLSGDYPRSKVLAVILVAIFLGLAFAPLLFFSRKGLHARVAVVSLAVICV